MTLMTLTRGGAEGKLASTTSMAGTGSPSWAPLRWCWLFAYVVINSHSTASSSPHQVVLRSLQWYHRFINCSCLPKFDFLIAYNGKDCFTWHYGSVRYSIIKEAPRQVINSFPCLPKQVFLIAATEEMFMELCR
jgi:hypothetical protein